MQKKTNGFSNTLTSKSVQYTIDFLSHFRFPNKVAESLCELERNSKVLHGDVKLNSVQQNAGAAAADFQLYRSNK